MKQCITGNHLRHTHPNAVVPRLSFRLQGLYPQPAANGPTAQTVAALDLISNNPYLKTHKKAQEHIFIKWLTNLRQLFVIIIFYRLIAESC